VARATCAGKAPHLTLCRENAQTFHSSICIIAITMTATESQYRRALIVGAGQGLSASLARALIGRGIDVALAARDVQKLSELAASSGARLFKADAQVEADVDRLFAEVDRQLGTPDIVVYNASARVRGPITTLDADAVRKSLMVTAFGAFLVAQRAAARMLPNRHGAILFTGASASVKGYAQSAPFAMGKFAVRGLAQSMARELAPSGIHVAHFVIDGAIRPRGQSDPDDRALDPDAIAEAYLGVLMQPRSAWTWEVELRPWVERF